MSRIALVVCILGTLVGCGAPGARLSFPMQPVVTDATRRSWDVDNNGLVDFSIAHDASGRFDLLEYDDDEDGEPDRIYRLSEYADDEVPHFILLLDSIPFAATRDRFESAGWTFFEPPTRVIAPFPTMSGVIFSVVMDVAPAEGGNNRFYDTRVGRRRDHIWARLWGRTNAWQRELDYRASYLQNGMAFLKPRPWFKAEMELARRAFDESGSRETIAYIASTSGMMSTYGRDGLEEILDEVERLCMQLLHERDGAVKISILSDHGHNLMKPERIDLEPALRNAGFDPASRIRSDTDVVIDLDGLVNYAGLHTHRAREVAEALAQLEAVEVTLFIESDRVHVLESGGQGFVERRDGRLRFTPLEGDPLDYATVIDRMDRAGSLDADGFADPDDWFDATVDHEWPDAPARIWEAFHGLLVSTPDVMLAIRDGYCVGDKSFEKYIDMVSTHGGLNQINSAGVLLTMCREIDADLRSRDVLPALRERRERRHDP